MLRGVGSVAQTAGCLKLENINVNFIEAPTYVTVQKALRGTIALAAGAASVFAGAGKNRKENGSEDSYNSNYH